MAAVEGEIVEFSKSDKKDAEAVEKQINHVVETVAWEESDLESNYALLGNLLREVRDKKYWLIYGDFKSFGDYMKSIETKVHKKKSTLYNSMTIAENLIPLIGEKDLGKMGISKASLLNKMFKDGKKPSEELIEKAKSEKTTIDELSASVAEEAGWQPEGDKGVYFSLGGVFFTPEEHKEFMDGVNLAVVEAGLKHKVDRWQNTTPEEKKAIILAWVAEFKSEWGGTEQ